MRARNSISSHLSSSSFLFRSCRQCASLYKYIRTYARERARIRPRLSPRVKQRISFVPVLSCSLRTFISLSPFGLRSSSFCSTFSAPFSRETREEYSRSTFFSQECGVVTFAKRYDRNARDVLYRFHTCVREYSSVGNSRHLLASFREVGASKVR